MYNKQNKKDYIVSRLKDIFEGNRLQDCYVFGNSLAMRIGDWILELPPTWRLLNRDIPLLGSGDVYPPDDENNTSYDYNQSINILNDNIKSILKCRISRVSVGSFNDLNIVFSSGVEVQYYSDVVICKNEYYARLFNKDIAFEARLGCGFVLISEGKKGDAYHSG